MKKVLLVLVLVLSSLTSCEKEVEGTTILQELRVEISWKEQIIGEDSFMSFDYSNSEYTQAYSSNKGECYAIFNGTNYGYIITVIVDSESRYEISINDSGSIFNRVFYKDKNGIMIHEVVYYDSEGQHSYLKNIYPSTIDLSKVQSCIVDQMFQKKQQIK